MSSKIFEERLNKLNQRINQHAEKQKIINSNEEGDDGIPTFRDGFNYSSSQEFINTNIANIGKQIRDLDTESHQAHDKGIYKIHRIGQRTFVSLANDLTLKVWNLRSKS